MAAGWTDEHEGLRACRVRLRERYPALTSSTLASALGFHSTWYSRVESGKAGLTVANFARLAGGVLGLLAATYPSDVWTLHDLIRDVPRPDRLPPLPSLPTEPHTYTWHTEDLRIELGRVQERRAPIAIPEVTAAIGLQHMVLYDIENGKSPGSIPTLLKLYTYFSRHLNRPLLLDEILTIARYIPAALMPLLDQQHLSVAAGT